MEFKYEKFLRKVTSDRDDIWLEDKGFFREGPLEFIFHYMGNQIAISFPDNNKDCIEPEFPGENIFTIGEVGFSLIRYREGERKVICPQFRFRNREEQDKILQLLKQALSKYVRNPNNPARVEYSKELTTKLEKGVLIDG